MSGDATAAVEALYRSDWGRIVATLIGLVGGLILLWVFIASLDSLWYPANSASGNSWFGVGPPFVLGVGFIVVGVVAMFLAAWFLPRSKSFFARKRETVETMVPYDDPDDVFVASRESAPTAG